MHVGGGAFAGAHGRDDGCCTGDDIASSPHGLFGRLARLFVGHDGTPLGALQAARVGKDHRVGPGAQSHDDHIDVHVKLGTLNGQGAAPTAGVGFAQLHAHAAHASHPALVVAKDLDGIGQKVKDNALFLGVMDLFGAGRDLLRRAAIDDVNLIGAQAQGAARGIHGYVTGPHHGHSAAHLHRRVPFGEAVPLHQVDAGQKLVGRKDAVVILAGDVHKHG